MRAAVTLLRRAGARLSKEEIASAAPIIGDLVLTDWRGGNNRNRALRLAQLKEIDPTNTVSRDLLPPLFDPMLIRVQGNSLVLVGIETQRISSTAEPLVDCAQGWLVRVESV